jgi:hypothetical protein
MIGKDGSLRPRKLTALRWIVLTVLHLVTVMLALFGAVAFGLLH